MAGDNNIFGEFGARSAKFDELLKKYQTIDENGEVVPHVKNEPAAEPVVEPSVDTAADSQEAESFAEPQPEPENNDADISDEEENVDAPVDEAAEEFESDSDSDEFVLYDAAAAVENYSQETAAEPAPENEPAEQEEESSGFVFDTQARFTENGDAVEETEPDYSYDINTFGKSKYGGALDIDSFDDSWLDTALDDSLFYKAVPAVEEPQVQEPASSKFVNAEAQQDDYEAPYTYEEADSAPYSEIGNGSMTGGYVAPSSLTDFQFDPDSGLDFDDADNTPNNLQQSGASSLVAKLKKKPSKEKKESGKNEMTAITDFSKSYKASEGKGSKKESFSFRNLLPDNNDSTVEKITKITVIVCVLVFLFSAAYLINYYFISPEKNANAIDKLEQLVGEEQGTADSQLLTQYPDVEFPEGMLAKYAPLYAENQDFVGWVKIDALDISQPVVRGENNKKYLTTDFNGRSGKYGTVFMNCANKVDRLNFNTALFGHHMLDSKMFGNLMAYKNVDGYKKAPVIEFNTIYGDFKWKIFAVFITNGTADGDDGYLFNYMFTDLTSNQKIESFFGELKQRSLYHPNVDVKPTDKILTLSTCTYEFDEARLVIVARMLRPGESEAVDTNVELNSNPRFPSAYYKEKGLSNPYASAYKWIPG